MGFAQALSGLNGASKALEAIGNNIANGGTVGFKSSAAQFSDVFASSLAGGGANQVGIGVSVSKVLQTFSQGNITTSGNPLDMAINGGGMFRLNTNGAISYTRSGQFLLDKSGYIVNGGGKQLTGFAADPLTGVIVPGNYQPLQMNNAPIPPVATALSQIQTNLDSRAVPPTAMTHGASVGSAPPTALAIVAGGEKFDVTVDGLGPYTVTVPLATYATVGDLAKALTLAINTQLSGTSAAVDVTANTAGALVVSSRSVGSFGSQGPASGSKVVLAAVAANTGFVDMFGAPTVSAGVDNFSSTNTNSFTASTAQTIYDSLGNPHTLSLYFAKTAQPGSWQMYSTIDNTPSPAPGSATGIIAPAINYLAGANQLSVTVDGVAAAAVTIPNALTPALVASGLQTLINTDAALVAAGKSVGVSINSSGQLVISSTTLGSASSIAVAGNGASALLGVTPVIAQGGPAKVDTLLFKSDGSLINTTPVSESFKITTGATSPLNFSVNLLGSTQYGISFGVNQLLQDGYTSGKISGLSISADGIVQGNYSNGKSRNLGQIVLATFTNPNGLQSMGGNQWSETADSGQPIPGTPGSGSLGTVQSGAIEESNVDLTAELVSMITQQRAYQANAQSIKTIDQVLQTLVNLR